MTLTFGSRNVPALAKACLKSVENPESEIHDTMAHRLHFNAVQHR